jgi:outer membrane protein TolC
VSAVGTGTIGIPGVSANFALKDALLGPKIARSAARAQEGDSAAAINDILLRVSQTYLDLLQAETERAIAENTVKHSQRLVGILTQYLKAGQGSEADLNRARVELASRLNQVQQAQSNKEVAEARLRELLNLNQNVRIAPTEVMVIPLQLVPPDIGANELIAAGLGNRPELVRSRNLVEAASYRLLRDKLSPLLPTLILGVSQGGYQGGPGTAMNNTHGRFDLDAIAYWEVRNLGLGEWAAQKLARSQLRLSQLDELAVMDQVAREVYEAYVQITNARPQIATSEKEVQSARLSYKQNMKKVDEAGGISPGPIEALQSIEALDQAQREYLRAVLAYNTAQFRLMWALGWPSNRQQLCGH